VVIVLLAAVPCHFYSAFASAAADADLVFHERFGPWWTASLVASFAICAIATGVPLWLGLRAFRRIEF
jgi:ABC-2 type transport system permease protein